MIKTGLKLSLIAILLSTMCMAKKTTNNDSKSLLWRISGNGLSKPSYLFGTMDLICPNDYVWTGKMEECFVKCDNICVEINSQDDGVKREVLGAFSNKNGKKLMDYFPNKDYDLIKSYANNSLGLDLSKYQAYQPIVIQPFIIKKLLGCSSPISYQAKILLLAKEKNKNVLSLATVADVVNEVEATHFNEKIAVVLDEMAHGSDYYHTYRQNVMNAYVHQDIQSDNLLFKKAKSFTQNDFKILLDNKNKKWVNKMPAMMQRSSTFFAVNALNLGGKEGVINLLRQAGYMVEPIQ